MNLRTIFSSILIIISLNALGQVNDKTIRLKVLKQNIIGREFVFNKYDKSTTRLTYLGTIRSKKRVDYKIVNSIWIWGQSHRATNRILVFDKTNEYLGSYYLTVSSDLPSSIQNNNLLFKNASGSDCDPKLTTYINFDTGIPKEFFRKCSGKNGDIYTFNKD